MKYIVMFPDGKQAWKKAIQDVANSLSSEGALLLRDFAAPSIHQDIRLNLLSEEAQEFYNYFRRRYRTFEQWDEVSANKMIDKRDNFEDYPEVDNFNSVNIKFQNASEMMLHFRNYLDNTEKGIIEKSDSSWKEIDECYLPPNPDKEGIVTMTPHEYIEQVVNISNQALVDSEFEMTCVQSEIVGRPKTVELFKKHFGIEAEGISDSDILFDQIPKKMELVFKKMKK